MSMCLTAGSQSNFTNIWSLSSSYLNNSKSFLHVFLMTNYLLCLCNTIQTNFDEAKAHENVQKKS